MRDFTTEDAEDAENTDAHHDACNRVLVNNHVPVGCVLDDAYYESIPGANLLQDVAGVLAKTAKSVVTSSPIVCRLVGLNLREAHVA